MGNEFNSCGEKTYLKALEYKTYMPLSQKDVYMTTDFSGLIPKMLGMVPVIIDTKSVINNNITKLLGNTAIANQIIIKRNELTGEYSPQIQVCTAGLTTGAYLHNTKIPGSKIIINPGIQTGWEQQANGGWKYINEFGSYIKGDWKQYKEKWYYLNDDEYMVVGWKKIGKKWYYFKLGQENGYMVLGWREIDGKWYYFKTEGEAGYMVTGWRMIDEKWYYFEADGHMSTGWKEIAGKKYYLYDDGHCAILEDVEDINTGMTYYADANGVCTPSKPNIPLSSKPFANMTLQQKKDYIYQYDYSTEAKAQKYITRITVPIWAYENNDPNKRKIKATRNVQVNELVADDLVDIFNEIFNDPEQFPIYYYSGGGYYQVEGYHYRASRGGSKPSVHSCGAAVDINAYYNPYKKTPSAGPFKIESNGSVVRIFTEHGWYWGGEFSTGSLDYMHFSLLEKGVNSRI